MTVVCNGCKRRLQCTPDGPSPGDGYMPHGGWFGSRCLGSNAWFYHRRYAAKFGEPIPYCTACLEALRALEALAT